MAGSRPRPDPRTLTFRSRPRSAPWRVALPMLDRAGISSDGSLYDDEIMTAVARLRETGSVPLVHAPEWNLPPTTPST
ncbi:hypothetical protein FXW78_51580 [Rhodococcus opacus]|nr:hypothetical protein [Rhodococcus opacus]